MTNDELKLVLVERHKKWLAAEPGGARADLRHADLRWADLCRTDLRGADLCDADLRGADLRGADLDYSAWPLWCGSLEAKIDKRLACQLLYHTLRAMQSVDDPEVRAVLNNPDNINLANQFHHADKCGKLKAIQEEKNADR